MSAAGKVCVIKVLIKLESAAAVALVPLQWFAGVLITEFAACVVLEPWICKVCSNPLASIKRNRMVHDS